MSVIVSRVWRPTQGIDGAADRPFCPPRGETQVNGATDSYTVWFTTINKSYYSSYRQMLAWNYQGTRLELTNR